jgi:hypothetical protein
MPGSPGPRTWSVWCGHVVRTRARLRFGVVVGMFTEGASAGRLCVHRPYRFGGRTPAQWEPGEQGDLLLAVPFPVVLHLGATAKRLHDRCEA